MIVMEARGGRRTRRKFCIVVSKRSDNGTDEHPGYVRIRSCTFVNLAFVQRPITWFTARTVVRSRGSMKSCKHVRIVISLLALVITCHLANAVAATIPTGSAVQVRITEHLTSQKAKSGDVFHGVLTAPIVANGRVLYPKGSPVTGQVLAVHPSGRLSDPGVLELALTSVGSGRNTARLATETFQIKGESHTKSNITKIGGGTAAGAILGGIFGGGKGAAIGAGVGAAGGTAVAAATGRKEAEVESEAVLNFRTAAPATQVREPRYSAQSENPREDSPRGRYRDAEYDRDRDEMAGPVFSARDRRVIQSCAAESYSNLPPGLAKKDRLPPGLERQLQRNGTLPPGLQKRVRPLPGECESQLPPLPSGWARVVLSGRILLLDRGSRILDMFTLSAAY